MTTERRAPQASITREGMLMIYRCGHVVDVSQFPNGAPVRCADCHPPMTAEQREAASRATFAAYAQAAERYPEPREDGWSR